VTLTAAIIAFVNGVLTVVVQFGVSLTDTQIAAITGLVNAGLVLITAALSYRKQAQRAPVA
jgi:hypothetical protein